MLIPSLLMLGGLVLLDAGAEGLVINELLP
jgi:hypothetical protein